MLIRFICFIFIRSNEDVYFDVPISILESDIETNIISIMIEIRGVKTKQLLNIEKDEDIEFLGYKIGKKRTNLIKPLFYRIVRLYRRMKDKSKRRAKTLVSLWGWFKSSTYSYLYYKKYLENIISFKKIKQLLQKRSA